VSSRRRGGLRRGWRERRVRRDGGRACLAAGAVVCTPEGPQCDAVPGAPADEICDGIDNDCNGPIDDVPGLGDACSAGEGACAAAGTVVCTPGGPACDAVPGAPEAEAALGLNNSVEWERVVYARRD